MTNTDKVFYNCVKALKWTAKKTGTTYNQVNVAVFCVIWPVITIGLAGTCVVLANRNN